MRLPFLLAVLLPAAAHADWQQTRWGMTEAEARAAVPGATSSQPGRPRVTKNLGEARLGFSWDSGDLKFAGTMHFSRRTGGLSAVTLDIVGDDSQCAAAEFALLSKYGSPMDRSQAPLFRSLTWLAEATRISFWHGNGSADAFKGCSIVYSTRALDDASGL